MTIQKIVQTLLNAESVNDEGIKRVTATLSFVKYAELCKLSKELGVSPSGLSKTLLEESIESAKYHYLQATGLDESFQDEVDVHVENLLRQSQG